MHMTVMLPLARFCSKSFHIVTPRDQPHARQGLVLCAEPYSDIHTCGDTATNEIQLDVSGVYRLPGIIETNHISLVIASRTI